MKLKQSGALVLTLLWFTGCAVTEQIGKADPGDSANIEETGNLTGKAETIQPPGAASTIDSETATPSSATETSQVLTLSRLLQRLDRVATLEPGSTKQRIQQMDARFDQLNPADQYEFALLITQQSTSSRSLNRAISILNELQTRVDDRIVKEILLLHRRYFILKKQYRSERNKSIGLEKKIERLKGLEQDLDKSNSRMQEPLNPASGEPRQP
ncbi:MAG: hypothetical protein ABW098_08825 [Candidatus Thiodiazotropha sp.]